MSFIFAVEAMKFYKLKRESIARVLFSICFVVNGLFLYFRMGNASVRKMSNALNVFVAEPSVNNLLAIQSGFDKDFFAIIALEIALLLFDGFLCYLYAAAYNAERLGRPEKEAMLALLKNLPRFLVFALLLLAVLLLSVPLFLIPFVVVLLILIFTPLFLAEKSEQKHEEAMKMTLGRAMKASMTLSDHRKTSMFLSFFIVQIIFGGLRDMVISLLPDATAAFLFSAFMGAVLAMMYGRLVGAYYFFFKIKAAGKSLQEIVNGDPEAFFRSVTGEDDQDDTLPRT